MLPRERKTADHRVLGRILELSFGQKEPKDSTINFISELYMRMGGSWVGFFQGDPKQVRLLKQCSAAVVKREKENER
tara:strand:- start:371 stop:601 length:231 start_codon:yes stop_codon:yes gene_type:complete